MVRGKNGKNILKPQGVFSSGKKKGKRLLLTAEAAAKIMRKRNKSGG